MSPNGMVYCDRNLLSLGVYQNASLASLFERLAYIFHTFGALGIPEHGYVYADSII